MEKLRYCFMTSYTIFRKILMKKPEGTHLAVGQPGIPAFLTTHDGVSQAETADAVYLEPASLTSAISGMEKNGLIVRRRSGRDRRAFCVYLTDKGRGMDDVVESAFREMESMLLSRLPEELAGRIEEDEYTLYMALDSMLK